MEYFWLTVALVILIVLVRKPFKEHVLRALDARSDKIRQELDQAQRLHEEAKAMLAKYERQLHEGESMAKEILERVDVERARLEAKLEEEMKITTERRTQQALDRIAQEEARAVQEVRARAADLAARATRDILTEKLTPPEVERLMRDAVEQLNKKLAS